MFVMFATAVGFAITSAWAIMHTHTRTRTHVRTHARTHAREHISVGSFNSEVSTAVLYDR